MKTALLVKLPDGSEILAKECVNGNIEIQGTDFSVDLIILPLSEFDIILGMDWLVKHQVKIDCMEKRVQMKTQLGEEVIYYGKGRKIPFISVLKACKLLQKGNEGFLLFCVATRSEFWEVAGCSCSL
ncbi:hypothetical protein HPP92_021747 [Vanilla planifolia]|uniref:Uncharacterized protein n=1 Tax=Vanilla planifolia TaxID=51239 RepID=A0A835UD65_VANPL|nr:hypothetical protein HPP92_021747 [Vanilla planifolia]